MKPFTVNQYPTLAVAKNYKNLNSIELRRTITQMTKSKNLAIITKMFDRNPKFNNYKRNVWYNFVIQAKKNTIAHEHLKPYPTTDKNL